MRTRFVLLAAMSIAGCGSRDNNEPNQASPPQARDALATPAGDARPAVKENRVIEVQSSVDLLALNSTYQMLWESGFDGTLEVNIAAGAYAAQSWSLGPAPDSTRKGAAPTIDVVLRGGPAAPPPPGSIRARSLRIEDLVLVSQYAPWQLEVAESFTMTRSIVIDARGRKWDEGVAYLGILGRGAAGGGQTTPVTARIESSWFVRNWQGDSPSTMLGFGSVDTAPAYWESIEIDDSAFIGNAFAVSVRFQFAKAVTIARSLFYKPWPSGVIFDSVSSDVVHIDDSVIIAESADNLASHGSESPPMVLGKGTRVYVNGWTKSSAPPAALVADPSQFHDRAEIAAGDPVLAEAAKLPADALPPADLKAKLDAAARP